MNDIRKNIIENICYTDLVYGRINKKLSTKMTRQEIEQLVMDIISDKTSIIKKNGKNYYINNYNLNISITINSSTFRVITMSGI
ncbi:MAG: DUF3781 domain-containing protein [Streptococcaceae bacterium]|jgi:hypothetical protein|nr:DUF3781 domain-containing protein [Streptococcaceae bacterium]MCH4176244.1 DUF3781 domain-containing protein [Streptococcaceae bacterium]